MTVTKRLNLYTIVFFPLLTLVTALIAVPILVTVFASLKNAQELRVSLPLQLPAALDFSNYIEVAKRGHIVRGYVNSLFIVAVSLVANTLLASMVSYVLSRFEFRLKKAFFALFTLGMIVPAYVTEISRFHVIKTAGLFNTPWAAIVIFIAADLMQIFIYLQFMNNIPASLDESALIDGASYFGIYFRIILPLSIPAVATLAIIKGVDIMNDMYVPYLYMPRTTLNTVSTTIMRFAGTRYARWEYMSAAIMLVFVPTMALYLGFQRYVIQGITAGAVKE